MSAAQARIAELQEKIASLENLRDIIDDETVYQSQTELQSELDTLIQTEGGAVVAGDVDTGGGDFVRRDNNVTVGERGVAIGSSVSGSTIVTGNGNVVGSTVNLQGDYIQ